MAKKLSEEKIAQIKEKAKRCKSISELARECGVCTHTAYRYGYENAEERFEKKRQTERENYKYLVSIGICPRCKKNKAMPGGKLCLDCLNQIDSNRKKQVLTDSQKEAKRKQYYSRKESGICVKCGKRKAVIGKTRCLDCMIKARKYADSHRGKKMYKEKGLCLRCGSPVKPGYMYCEKCYNKQVEYGMKGFAAVNKEQAKRNHDQAMKICFINSRIKKELNESN